ncbi:MAG: preprotein translocase subunit YajC [Firmicutes bacterium]|nr:preprotein translocase subunit YajC [Bacillota bacterium]
MVPLAAAQPAAGGTAEIVSLLLPFAIVFVIFYFLIIRPQQKEQKKRQAMLDALKKGQRVITVGGIFGEITDVKEDTLTLRIADKVEVKTTRSAVSQVLK